jgi:elongation factor Ts
MVKALRDKTGAGMMDCKKALTEAGGDEEKAIAWLREKGLSKAQKRAGRATSEGLFGQAVSEDGKTATLAELKCETDFVAKADQFTGFAQELADAAQAGLPESPAPAPIPEDFLAGGLQDKLNELVAVLGENILVGRYARLALGEGGRVGLYVHATGKIAVMVSMTFPDDATAATPEAQDLAKDLAMQVAAASPVCVGPDELPQDMLEKEKEIYRQQALGEGKPENIVDKIVIGRVQKYYKEVCLLEQPFIKDDKKAVKDLLGKGVTVHGFVRMNLGEDAE